MARIFSKMIVVETQMYDVTINHIVSSIKIFKFINLQRKKKAFVYVCYVNRYGYADLCESTATYYA